MKKNFELNNITRFVDKILEKKNLWEIAPKIKEEIDLDEKNC
jgi:hypothetical protein